MVCGSLRLFSFSWENRPRRLRSRLREGVINALVVQNPFEMGYKGVERQQFRSF
jgi:ABC-type sugar transport system substrate-binding protein